MIANKDKKLLEYWLFGNVSKKELKKLRGKWEVDYDFFYSSRGFEAYKEMENFKDNINKIKDKIIKFLNKLKLWNNY